MRRHDRQLPAVEAERILQQVEYGVLSTVGDNGYAYGVPLSYVYLDHSLYFHCAGEGHKLDNIDFNDRVSFCVVGNTMTLPEKFTARYESVIVFGRAAEVQGTEKQQALLALVRKYSAGFLEKGSKYVEKEGPVTKVIRLSIEWMTAKAND